MSQRKKVVVTGAAGTVAGLLLPELRERYDLTLLDRSATDRTGRPIEGVVEADLLDQNRDGWRRFFRNAFAVVHCSIVRPDPPTPANTRLSFPAAFASIEMTRNVFQIALEEGARRVVVASSNHATDYYEPFLRKGEMAVISPDAQALSYNYYGWSKQACEHLGFVFAAGQVAGRPLENIHIRVGVPRESEVKRCPPGDLECMHRALAAYISQRDLAQLFVKSIEAEDIRDARGVPFQVFYGISGNTRAYWSIESARKVIGYEPQDDSEVKFREQIAEHMRAAEASPPGGK